MNILLVHNYYSVRGGEDVVVEQEKELLGKNGHRIVTYFVTNRDIDCFSIFRKLSLFFHALYNRQVAREIERLIVEGQIDFVHVHNYWPRISPSVFFLCNSLRIPYLQTVHNYRYLAANALLYKDDVVPPGNRLRIRYRGLRSFKGSLVLTLLYRVVALFVRKSRVFEKGGGGLQVLNRFSYDVHAQIFPEERLFLRGNFLPDSEVAQMVRAPKQNYYLYLGRLAKEKGIITLLRAFCSLCSESRLIVAGNGPLETDLREQYRADPNIEFTGFVSGEEKRLLLTQAKALIVPSECQETFGMTLVEAFFASTPVIAAEIGAFRDMVEDGVNGLLFESGNEHKLLGKLQWCERHGTELALFGENARHYAEKHFDEAESYARLMEIYSACMQRGRNTVVGRSAEDSCFSTLLGMTAVPPCISLPDNTDWEHLYRLILYHRVLNPVATMLASTKQLQYIPLEILDKLRRQALWNAAVSLRMTEELFSLKNLFAAGEIPFCCFKGPVLAQIAYGDLSLRSFVDIDLLVAQSDAARVCDLLRENGYSIFPELTAEELLKYMDFEDHVVVKNSANNIEIDLHWDLCGSYAMCPLRLETVLSSLQLVDLEGHPVPTLSVEDTVVHLCVHASSHCWATLESIASLARLLAQNPRIDWERIRERTEFLRCRRLLLLGLSLAGKLYNSSLPDMENVQIQQERRIYRLREKVLQHLCACTVDTMTQDFSWRFSGFHFLVRDSFADALRYGARMLFVPTLKEWVIFPLPSSLSFLYFPLRPIRLLGELFSSLRKTLLGTDRGGAE